MSRLYDDGGPEYEPGSIEEIETSMHMRGEACAWAARNGPAANSYFHLEPES